MKHKEAEIKNEDNKDKNESNENNNEKSEEIKDNNNADNNINSPTQANIPMMFGPGMGGIGMIPMGIPQGNQINFQSQNKLSSPMQPFMGYNQLNEEEEDDEPDPILDDDTTDLNTINTFALMENTALIVKKNLVENLPENPAISELYSLDILYKYFSITFFIYVLASFSTFSKFEFSV